MTEETRDHVVPGTGEPHKGEEVKGYDFEGEFDLDEFIDACRTTGFQATHLAEAVDIIRDMQEDDAKIFLTFTSNIISSGLRESIAYLAREDLVDVMITTSGSHSEDLIKTEHPFKMGEWDADEKELREKGINRLGNIYAESDGYVWLEKWLNNEFFPEFFDSEKVRSPTEVAKELGKEVDDDRSFLNHAAENNIPVFCPALIEAEKTGIICVGAGVPKHQAIMSNLFRGGADYAVYISTGMEGDGSLSGAPPKEAVSWGKIKENARNYTQVEAEATLVWPLIVEAGFKDG
ncbi:MAG: deoxyhypusine synthase family protein [Candidatus Nanohaloarchaea archaeon]